MSTASARKQLAATSAGEVGCLECATTIWRAWTYNPRLNAIVVTIGTARGAGRAPPKPLKKGKSLGAASKCAHDGGGVVHAAACTNMGSAALKDTGSRVMRWLSTTPWKGW